jgi:alkanesulfonate monooxygenase SsuD/methylene tetrahydromethanopterin reductase-like flavin-dependent oxidoreductase (luciferase family)
MAQKPNRRSRLRAMIERLRRLWRPSPEAPEDPYAYRMAPARRGPKGRSGAAVAEPEEELGS